MNTALPRKTAIPDAAMRMIGTERVSFYDVTLKDIKRFAQAIGDTDPLYFDEAYAATTEHGSIVAPPLFCLSFSFQDVPPEELPPDGSPMELNIPLPANRSVGGGGEFEFFKRIRPGDRIQVVSTLKEIYVKEGKSGPLFFIVMETAYFNQLGELTAKDTATVIKR